MAYIPYGRQNISSQDIEAVVKVLQSDWLTTGPMVEEFEQQVAAYCGAKYGVAVNSATSALHLACMAVDLGQGDCLWTTPNTFVASANCALYCGASVDFVDIDPETYNMSGEALAEKLEIAKRESRLPKAIVVVHFAGQPCEMELISCLAKKYGIVVIEDASHAIGATYLQTRTGDCTYSDMTVFSFHPVKIITTGEGGMITTNNSLLRDRLLLHRSHGITRNNEQMTEPSHGDWYYQQIDMGYNYRITDIQCALGVSQLQRVDDFLQCRRTIAGRYDQRLRDLPVILPCQRSGCHSAWHLYVIQIKEEARVNRKEVFDALRAADIGVNVHYIPVHMQPYYQQKFGFKQGDFPQAETYYRRTLSLPMFVGLKTEEQEYVVKTLTQVLR